MSLILKSQPFLLILLLALVISAAPASAQRIQFPTTISPPSTGTANTSPNLLTPPTTTAYQPPTTFYSPSTSSPNSVYPTQNTYAQQAPSYSQPSPAYGQSSPSYTQPAQGAAQQTPGYIQPTPGSGQTTPGYGQPSPAYAPPGSSTYVPPGNSTYVPPGNSTYVPPGSGYTSPMAPPLLPPPGSPAAPGVAGGVPAPGTWDPYAAPCPSSTPTPLLQQDPYFQYGQPAVPAMAMTRALQAIKLDYHWFAGHGGNELGINDVELNATIAIPFLRNAETPLLITPGFAVHYWEGPISDPVTMRPSLPPRTYDAYLDTAWNPQLLTWLGGELSFRIGIYDDFVRQITTDSLRFTGTGLGVVSLSPNFKVKAGVMYLDREHIKLLPSGGVVWTPNPDWYFNILFPNPKVGRRLINYGTAEWWLYFAGDYGGGDWHITQRDPTEYDDFDYDDIRIAVGIEFKTYRNLNGWFEVGGALSRELNFRDLDPPAVYPSNTVFLRAGLAY